MNTRIGARIAENLRRRMEEAVKSGRFSSISDMIREAVEKVLEEA